VRALPAHRRIRLFPGTGKKKKKKKKGREKREAIYPLGPLLFVKERGRREKGERGGHWISRSLLEIMPLTAPCHFNTSIS